MAGDEQDGGGAGGTCSAGRDYDAMRAATEAAN